MLTFVTTLWRVLVLFIDEETEKNKKKEKKRKEAGDLFNSQNRVEFLLNSAEVKHKYLKRNKYSFEDLVYFYGLYDFWL